MSEVLKGTIERVVFQNPEGFCVLSVRAGRDVHNVVGVAPELKAGEQIAAHGQWANHARFGPQFKATKIDAQMPETLDHLQVYLESGAVRGIGARTADLLVRHFGANLFKMLDNPEELKQVSGIGPKKAADIAASWKDARDSREAMMFLQGHGLGANRSRKVWDTYGPQTIAKVKDNPYKTLMAIDGIGFVIADDIARSVGIAPDHPDRVRFGIVHTLNDRADSGHTVASQDTLIKAARKLLEVNPDLINRELYGLLQDGTIMDNEDGRVGLPWLIGCERKIARDFQRRRTLPGYRADHEIRSSGDILLTDSQKAAVQTLLAEPVAVLTGGPGVGKTTVMKTFCNELSRQPGMAGGVLLCAPTGRAAKRISESTGRDASTIHRLLGASPQGFKHNEDNPIVARAVVIDEVSMVDVGLMTSLVNALPKDCRLIMVGDPDQLPPVGAGNVLRDILASATIPVAELTQVHRQKDGSQISAQAHAINHGEMPLEYDDFQIVQLPEEPELLADEVVRLATRDLPNRGFDPFQDIQVLTPMHKGPLGTMALNERIREQLHPGKRGELVYGRRWIKGDKVIQTKNDYNLDIFNGDVGLVQQVISENNMLVVSFDGRAVMMEADETENLQLAYAMTIHKSQGSEFKAVICPVSVSQYYMLERQLLYTGVTRGKQNVTLVADERGLKQAVRHVSGKRRETTLVDQLQEMDMLDEPVHSGGRNPSMAF